MALITIPWVNDRWMADSASLTTAAPGFSAVPLLDAAADRITMAGRFIHKDRGVAKTVDGVGFLFGTVVKTLLSTLKVSLQDVDLTVGPPLREDGTPDQTLSIANADAGFATDLWYEAGFDGAATRSLTHGDLIAVVFQFDSFVAGDSAIIRGLTHVSGVTGLVTIQGALVTNLTGSYALQPVHPNCVLRCSDGSYGTIEDSIVCSAINTHTFANNTAVADEYAIGIQYPFPVKLDGLWFKVAPATAAANNTEFLLYNGTTALATVNVDHNSVAVATGQPLMLPHAEVSLAANTLYRIAIRPLNNNNLSIYSLDVAMANHLQCHPGGTNAHLWTRLDQGAWGGEVTTRRLFAGVRPSAFDDGAGGGGGGGAVSDFLAVGVR